MFFPLSSRRTENSQLPVGTIPPRASGFPTPENRLYQTSSFCYPNSVSLSTRRKSNNFLIILLFFVDILLVFKCSLVESGLRFAGKPFERSASSYLLCSNIQLNTEMAAKNSNLVIPRQWVKGSAVGSGSFGTVHLAMNKSNGKLFVVKSASSGAALQFLWNEADILENLSSPHIVRCLGHDVSEEANGDRNFNLFLEYMAGGSLSDVSKKFGGVLDESVIRLYTREILQGLAYLHRNDIVHSDLKCKNVLVGSSGNVKLADFGCARRLRSFKSHPCSKCEQRVSGTPLWMAPEVLRKEMLDFASDIWSLGCTVIEMASGRPPWSDEVSDPMAAIYKIACSDRTPAVPPNLSEEGEDFLRKCLQRDPKLRWTSEQLLDHPFVLEKSSEDSLEEETGSPTSILEARDWDSYSPGGSESHSKEQCSVGAPVSSPPRKVGCISDSWIDVRSG